MANVHRLACAWLLGALFAFAGGGARAGTAIGDVTAYLEQANQIRLTDHPRFAAMLADIHAANPPMTGLEQWRLRYLDAWEAEFTGNYPAAEKTLREIIDHSGHQGLVAQALGLLLNNYGLTRRYSLAFETARQAAAMVPNVKDPVAREALLRNLSQTTLEAGYTDLAIKYARMMREHPLPGQSLCYPMMLEVNAHFVAKDIHSDDRGLHQAIETCTANNQGVLAHALRLTEADLLLDEHEPQRALTLLDQIAPAMAREGYFQSSMALDLGRAKAHAALGHDAIARKLALGVVGKFGAQEFDQTLRDAYELLFELGKRSGDAMVALTYYQQFAKQDRAYLDDMSTRTMAYEAVKQRGLLDALEADGLARQNEVLQLEKKLTTKAVETGRLYIALLGLVLTSLAVWLWRVKRSQVRFRQLSRHDGLTGILNHQHFMTELERQLHILEASNAPACLILLDLDHFKQVNDTYGHIVGDVVLQRAVAICRQQLRPVDVFGRLGGEEFGVLLPSCYPEQGIVVANCIRAAIEATPVEADGHVVAFSVSVGVASSMFSGHNAQGLRREADAALYRAKRGGRNRVMTDLQGDGLVGA